MNNQFDITNHIDYNNHMKNYIKKTEAMRIIENLKRQLLTERPIQSHPDYPAFVRLMEEKHQKEMSQLEKEMRRKTTMTDINLHPDYKKLVDTYESKIRAVSTQLQTQERDFKLKLAEFRCPPPMKCPECPSPIKCPPLPACPPQFINDYKLTATKVPEKTAPFKFREPTAFNNFQLGSGRV
jgi:hypothetical protein